VLICDFFAQIVPLEVFSDLQPSVSVASSRCLAALYSPKNAGAKADQIPSGKAKKR
jgi:hypothetical protein